MAWDFTADSGKQSELSVTLKNASENFVKQKDAIYTKIGELSTYWVGEDYNAFVEGTNGYKTALQDFGNSIMVFSDYFKDLSENTVELSDALIKAIGEFSDACADLANVSFDSPFDAAIGGGGNSGSGGENNGTEETIWEWIQEQNQIKSLLENEGLSSTEIEELLNKLSASEITIEDIKENYSVDSLAIKLGVPTKSIQALINVINIDVGAIYSSGSSEDAQAEDSSYDEEESTEGETEVEDEEDEEEESEDESLEEVEDDDDIAEEEDLDEEEEEEPVDDGENENLDTSKIPKSSLSITEVESYVVPCLGERYEGYKLYDSAKVVRDKLIRERDILDAYVHALDNSGLDSATFEVINKFLRGESDSRTLILDGDEKSTDVDLQKGLVFACSGGFLQDDGVFYDAQSSIESHRYLDETGDVYIYEYYDEARKKFNNEIRNLSSLDGINEYLKSVGLESIIQK